MFIPSWLTIFLYDVVLASYNVLSLQALSRTVKLLDESVSCFVTFGKIRTYSAISVNLLWNGIARTFNFVFYHRNVYIILESFRRNLTVNKNDGEVSFLRFVYR